MNGGLYTGTPFEPDAPWRNYPIQPDAGVYAFNGLRGIAPDAALHMLPGGGLRIGNNTPLLSQAYAASRLPHLTAVCVPPSEYAGQQQPQQQQQQQGWEEWQGAAGYRSRQYGGWEQPTNKGVP